jgi:hypothetical protein
MGSFVYGNRKRITTYVKPERYDKLEAERAKTGESQSELAPSILECFVHEVCNVQAGKEVEKTEENIIKEVSLNF